MQLPHHQVLWPRNSSTCRIADSATAFKIKSSMVEKLRTSDFSKIIRLLPITCFSPLFNRSRDKLCDVGCLASQSPSGNCGILACSTVCRRPLPTLSRFTGICSCWNCIALNRRPRYSPFNFHCCHDKLNPNYNNSPNFMQNGSHPCLPHLALGTLDCAKAQ